ncbi:ATP-binding protein [Delftia tsuruhatensis]|uniref:ATP-binding protein n=1 Tax=Delftia tsuruhatensis TaxID=180282 RepID=UPI003D25B61B
MTSQSTNPLQLSLDRISSNPLLEALPKQRSPLELAIALRFRHITPGNVVNIEFKNRQLLVDEYKKIFIPTTQSLSIAQSLQRMIYDGLAQRDPRQANARTFIYKSGQLKGKELDKLEWWPSFASGMIIDGITGTGKSQLMDRFLSLIPQVIEHETTPECGWKSLKQLVWLKIHMPSDGTRGGLLQSAFLELDKVLDTDYARQYSSTRWTVEKLLVVFLHILSVHRCGILIIEEAQEKNLSQSVFGRDFITFFLRLLNWGIPTVLIGNPLAFSKLRDFSQDVDRFSEGGWFHMHPLMDPNSEDWIEDWLPGLWSPTLLDQADADYLPVSKDPMDQTLAGFIWRRTAGVPRYVCRLRREVQEVALRTGASQVTAAMVDEVYRTNEKMTALHQRIDAFVRRDWRALQRFDDIPWDYFRRLWNPLPEEKDEIHAQPPVSGAPKNRSQGKTTQSAASKKPRATKAKPTPAETHSPAEAKTKQFQDAMAQNMAIAAGVGAT